MQACDYWKHTQYQYLCPKNCHHNQRGILKPQPSKHQCNFFGMSLVLLFLKSLKSSWWRQSGFYDVFFGCEHFCCKITKKIRSSNIKEPLHTSTVIFKEIQVDQHLPSAIGESYLYSKDTSNIPNYCQLPCQLSVYSELSSFVSNHSTVLSHLLSDVLIFNSGSTLDRLTRLVSNVSSRNSKRHDQN